MYKPIVNNEKIFDLTWLAFPIKQQNTIKCAIYQQKMQNIIFLHKIKANLNNTDINIVNNQKSKLLSVFLWENPTCMLSRHIHI